MTPLRISIVEDHPVLRDVLEEYVGRLPGVEVCIVSGSAEAALQDFDDSKPDLMLIDLSLPRMSGIDLIRELRLRQPELLCAILSGHRSSVYVRQALEVGANGYLLKGDPEEIERGIQAILAGKRYVSPELAELP
jgi:DNA-binding NarL/FixJ family response regulator